MDPIAVLQNRIEQLEAKLGLAPNAPENIHQHHGDSATTNLLHAAQGITNATVGHEKLPEAMHLASELNNYTDPNLAENLQQNEMHAQEVAAAENVIRHHCHCMHQCRQAAPVMDSQPIQQVPQMQETVNNLQAAAAEVKADADVVSQGVAELAETVGNAAANASEQLAAVAEKVDQVEEKKFPRRRNGLD
ncbi:uncharacterized protein LOC113233286 [Hyposmocoma kahamanoa]|uniref:uncharacterized protein LOC113233286 n=1 Tax=Hyposmocoma kahamanoa TaxID=1477025 RepID=UPI000E6D7FBF|nr:uncharacterized protein LOC113233286 [Hyposmocoma kahamanoa]